MVVRGSGRRMTAIRLELDEALESGRAAQVEQERSESGR